MLRFWLVHGIIVRFMSKKFTRMTLTASALITLALQASTAFAQCASNLQPCNGSCIPETDLCILEPLPGASAQISSSGFQVFLDYVNGTSGSPGLWEWAFRVGVAIAILNGVFAGFQIVLSNGDSGAVDAGKKRFMGSAIGLAMLLLSGVILHFINPYGFGTPTTPAF
jgi:hypothetical protein